MSGANERFGAVRLRRGPARKAQPSKPAVVPRESIPGRRKAVEEIGALLHLAELDTALFRREAEGQAPAYDEVADERHGLGARISPENREAYERALRAGRQPAVVRLVASVCSGCYVRLHSKLDHQIRQHRGIAPCPRCLRLVYDPAWVEAVGPCR